MGVKQNHVFYTNTAACLPWLGKIPWLSTEKFEAERQIYRTCPKCKVLWDQDF